MTAPNEKRRSKERKRRNETKQLGRSWALAMLYALEFAEGRGYLYTHFPGLVPRAHEVPEAFTFARELVNGVVDNGEEVDDVVQKSSPRWRVRRMSLIDRNILRLATFEIVHRPDVPPRVVINEAVELAKRYGAQQTSGFVNGILQQICTDNGISV